MEKKKEPNISGVVFIGAVLLGLFTNLLGIPLLSGIFYIIAGLSGFWWVFKRLEF